MQSYTSIQRNFTPQKWGTVPWHALNLQGFMGHNGPATQHELPLRSCMNRANVILETWCNCWNNSHRSAVHILMGMVEKNGEFTKLYWKLIWEQEKIICCESINSIWLSKGRAEDDLIKVYRSWEKTLMCKDSSSWRDNNITTTPPPQHPPKGEKNPKTWKLNTDKTETKSFSNSENKCWNKLPKNEEFFLLVYLQIMIQVRILPNIRCSLVK